MKVSVLLFAMARQIVGQERIELEVGERATVGELRAAIGQRYASLAPLVRSSLFAVNQQYVSDPTALSAEQEIALIPPVSGG